MNLPANWEPPLTCKNERCWNKPEPSRQECKVCLKRKKRASRGREIPGRYAVHLDARSKAMYTKYGIDEADWWLMLEAQEWACLICSRPWEKADPSQHWHIDHDHGTGKVRGILCTHCNLGLGHFRDNPQYLRQAAEYLALTG